MMAADEGSKFLSLLIRISKLLSKQNVEQLVFVAMKDINNRSLSEECETSGNALKIFQSMMDRDLYTFEDPSLLIQHLKLIGRDDAVKLFQQEIDSLPLYSNHSSEQLNQGSRERIFRPAQPTHAKPGPPRDPQATQSQLKKAQAFMASVTQPTDVFIDGAFNTDKGTTTTPPHIQVSDSKMLEPEASFLGDPTSPRNLPDIPDNSSAASTGHMVQGSEGTFLFPESKIPEIPKRPPQGNRGFEGYPENKQEGSIGHLTTAGDPVTSLLSTQTATVTPTRCYQNIPERPPRGSSRDTSSPVTPAGYSLHMSQGVVTPAAPRQVTHTAAPQQITFGAIPQQISRGATPQQIGHTVVPQRVTQSAASHQTFDTIVLNGFTHSSLPQQINYAATPVTTCYVNQQPVTRHGLGVMSDSKIEVEPLQGRAPSIPPRPPRGHARADNAVSELELNQLSRCLDAQVYDLFGLELGFDSGRISQLRHDSPHDISRAFYRLMVEWRNGQQFNSNMRGNLANHLRNIGCVGLASDLEAGQFSRWQVTSWGLTLEGSPN